MKLIYRIALRLSLALLPIMAIWAAVFYFMLVDEINDESDDALENYSELIISRMLSGRALPPLPAADAGPCRIAQRRRGRRHPHL